MNIKELLVIVLLAFATTWGIEYLFFKKTPESLKAGQGFVIPQERQDLLKPLHTEIDFIDAKRPAPATSVEVETDHAQLVFSSDGATLERLEFKRSCHGKANTITTIFPANAADREKRAFLVAFAEKTPYYYTLMNQQDTPDTAELTYQAETEQMTVKKTFVVSKHSHKIELTLTLIPKNAQEVAARIFYPSPLVPDIVSTDYKSALVSDERGSITKIAAANLVNKAWFAPTLAGTDDRYFVHAMVDDPAHFTQRAYFKGPVSQDLFTILEGPAVAQEQSWTLSFYFGPKEEKAIHAVDPRLNQILDYAGWFAPISRFMLMLLTFFYSYVHNYGWAIIILTILIKLLLLPFTLKGAQSMKKGSEMQRKLQYLQQKYKDDPEVLARERAELIRKHGMPGMAGCLPLLLQIPVFIALSRVLSSALELYKAPFLWITDLSAVDPYYVLPILIGASMLLQSTTVDSKQRMQFIVMALVFGVISAGFSAGLALYVFVSTFLGVMQAYLQKKLNWA